MSESGMKEVIFNLTEEQDERLARLAKKMGVDKTEALRRAIELYRLIEEQRKEFGL
ncbi:hypothetical protein LCGC14_2093930 [marine sediment metagenome]|uniref:Ribbon-helix-helix protein CopG domain-containing protein n=1 Tax=marine sediment metagenome TaxID=412755 RepID=A0A0F9EZ94_9ZZZZ